MHRLVYAFNLSSFSISADSLYPFDVFWSCFCVFHVLTAYIIFFRAELDLTFHFHCWFSAAIYCMWGSFVLLWNVLRLWNLFLLHFPSFFFLEVFVFVPYHLASLAFFIGFLSINRHLNEVSFSFKLLLLILCFYVVYALSYASCLLLGCIFFFGKDLFYLIIECIKSLSMIILWCVCSFRIHVLSSYVYVLFYFYLTCDTYELSTW